jgi:hypothetical protein
MPGVVTYDIVLKSLMADNMDIGLRFIQPRRLDLVRLQLLCADKIRAHLGVLIDLRVYVWSLVWGETDGRGTAINLRLRAGGVITSLANELCDK